jgi:hypothetical protein
MAKSFIFGDGVASERPETCNRMRFCWRKRSSAFYAFWRGSMSLVIRFQLRMQRVETGGELAEPLHRLV